MRRIATIVEGHGEVEAVPILVRRIAREISPNLEPDVPKPIRVRRNKILQIGELERAVTLAAERAGGMGCILMLFDANGDCPAMMGPQILTRAESARRDRDIRVVLAKTEYEAWFLAAASSLAGRRGLDEAIGRPPDPEAIRDAKGWLSARMPTGQSYRETLHQAALSAVFDLDAARAAPSFDKFYRDVRSLVDPSEQ